MTTKDIHLKFMTEAINLAQLAYNLGEVPVGALVVIDEQIVGRGFNRRELKNCVLEHAELNAIKDASLSLGRWRLSGATIYSTLEPCLMCAGAMIHARIDKLVYGACDKKFGAIESLYELGADSRLNHRFDSEGGVLSQESAKLLKTFFAQLRK